MTEQDKQTILRVAQSEADLRQELYQLRQRCARLHGAISQQLTRGAINCSTAIGDTDWISELANMAKGE